MPIKERPYFVARRHRQKMLRVATPFTLAARRRHMILYTLRDIMRQRCRCDERAVIADARQRTRHASPPAFVYGAAPYARFTRLLLIQQRAGAI